MRCMRCVHPAALALALLCGCGSAGAPSAVTPRTPAAAADRTAAVCAELEREAAEAMRPLREAMTSETVQWGGSSLDAYGRCIDAGRGTARRST